MACLQGNDLPTPLAAPDTAWLAGGINAGSTSLLADAVRLPAGGVEWLSR